MFCSRHFPLEHIAPSLGLQLFNGSGRAAIDAGAVVAGLEEMNKCPDSGASRAQRQESIAKGRERLQKTLPFAAPPERMVDAAVLFQIHPLNVIGDRTMENAILNLVQARLKGEVGI